MKIKQIMRKPVFVSPNASGKQLLKAAKKHKNERLFIIVDKNKKILGDINEDDLFYMLYPNENYEDIGVELAFDIEKKFFANNAKEIMRKHDIVCHEDDEIMDVATQIAGEE